MPADAATTVENLADKATVSARDTYDTAREHGEALIDQAANATGRFVREKPLQSAVLLFAAGFATAMLVRHR